MKRLTLGIILLLDPLRIISTENKPEGEKNSPLKKENQSSFSSNNANNNNKPTNGDNNTIQPKQCPETRTISSLEKDDLRIHKWTIEEDREGNSKCMSKGTIYLLNATTNKGLRSEQLFYNSNRTEYVSIGEECWGPLWRCF